MRLSFKTSGEGTDWPSLLAMWETAEEIPAYHAGWVFDHFIPLVSDPDGPCFEGWTLLAALAVRTERLRMGAMVTSNTHRHPAMLAHVAGTIDVLSGGRLELGLGAGWNDEEHRAYGIDLPPLTERFDRLEEALTVLDLLWTQPVSDFDGRYYRLEGARREPKPIQRPRPPFVIGGKGERRTIPIAARWADQWNFPGDDADELRHKIGVLHSSCTAIGRDPADIEVSAQFRVQGGPAANAATAARLAAAGAQHVIVYFGAPYRPELLRPTADAITGAIGATA